MVLLLLIINKQFDTKVMIIKRSFKIKRYIDPNIKKGDIVRLHDGSGFTINTDKHPNDEAGYSIVNDYPELGFNNQLMDYNWTVVETDIKDRAAYGIFDIIYIQDIIVECNGVQFRTASGLVGKI